MITYNEAFDINHTLCRMFLLLDRLKFDSVEYERLRIWDFYMAFPYEVGKIRFGINPEDREIKKLFPEKINPYRNIVNPRKLYNRMHPYQMIAIGKMAAYSIVGKDYVSTGRINIIDRPKLQAITGDLDLVLDDREQNVLKILTTYFYHMDFYGVNGLKSRTRLSEYHYDE